MKKNTVDNKTEKTRKSFKGLIGCVAALAIGIVLFSGIKSGIKETKPTIEITQLYHDLEEAAELCTYKYSFEDMVDTTSAKTLWGIELGFTKNRLIGKYAGIVNAGIDLSDARISDDSNSKTIVVELPEVHILSCNVSPEEISAKDSFWNAVEPDDLVYALEEIKVQETQKAIDNHILEKAEAHAQKIIEDMFLNSCAGYSIEFI